MRRRNRFNVKGVCVGMGRRGVEVQPGTRDFGVHLVALEALSDTGELHVYLQEAALQRFSSFVKGNNLFP